MIVSTPNSTPQVSSSSLAGAVPSRPRRPAVVVIKTRPETVLDDVRDMMRRAGYQDVLPKTATTIIKDNISWHLHYPSANTTPWQLEGVVRTMRQDGYSDIIGVHNRTVVTDASLGDRNNKFRGVYKRYGVPTYDNFSPDYPWVKYVPKGKMLVMDRIFPDGIVIPAPFIGKNVVHLPTVKTHIYTTTTGAMKNAFGGLLKHNRHYCHRDIHRTLVDLLTIQKEIHPGLFAVMDGTICGNGAGPRAMEPVVKNYMLASSDMVAIDAVAAKMMGFDPMSLDFIRVAHEEGLGTGRVEEIDVVGEDISGVNFGFSVSYHFAAKVGRALWYGKHQWLEHLMFRTPIVWAFIIASALFHDYYWYPFHGRKRRAEAMKSEWGRLFERYD